MRQDITTGDEFLMIKDKGRIILKKMEELAKDLRDDIEFASRVEKAWQDYDKGKFKSSSKADFIKELKKC